LLEKWQGMKTLNHAGRERMRKALVLAMVGLALMLCSCGDLLYNAKVGNVERIQKALESGVSSEKRDHLGNTPLMLAAFNKQYDALEYLCKKGADVNARNGNGATALIVAAYYNHPDVAKILLKYKADKAIKDYYGNTALYYAEGYSYTEMIALLKTP
jgi:ankyrin repeat protein